MLKRATWIALAAGGVLGAALLAAYGLDRRDAEGTAVGAGPEQEPSGFALPWVTPLPVTPTVPVTPTRMAGWYPTTAPYFLSPAAIASHVSFSPDGLDVAFTVNRAAEGHARDVFLAEADAEGRLTGTVVGLAGLPGDRDAVVVKASPQAGAYAVGGLARSGSPDGAGLDGVWLVDAEGGPAEAFTDVGAGIVDFWWLPDGSAVAMLLASGDLVVRDVATRTDRTVARTLLSPAGTPSAFLGFSPAGSWIAIGRHDPIDATATLELVETATGDTWTLADFEVVGAPVPVFSTDGTRVFAFVTDGAETSATSLYAVAIDPPGEPEPLADVSLGPDESSWVGSVVAHPSQPWLLYTQSGAIRAVHTETGEALVLVPRGEAVVRGDLAVKAVDGGGARIAFVTSTYLGPEGSATSDGQPATTTYAVQSIPVDVP